MTARERKLRTKSDQLLTEACPQMRQRIRREYIPELAAWLLLWGQRYEEQKKALLSTERLRELPTTGPTVAACDKAIAVIWNIMTDLYKTVPRHEWHRVVGEMREAMKALQDDGVVPLPKPEEAPTT